MYQKKSNLHNLTLVCLDCVTIILSLIMANLIRNKRAFLSDNDQMDFLLLLLISTIIFLLMSLFKQLYKNILTRGLLEETIQIVTTNLFLFAGTSVVLYFYGILNAYARWMFVYFLIIDCILMLCVHQLWKRFLPQIYKSLGHTRRLIVVADEKNAENVITEMFLQREFYYDLVGVVLTEDEIGRDTFCGVSIVASYDNLVSYCQTASIDEALVIIDENQDCNISSKLNDISDMGIILHYHIPIPKLLSARQKQLSKFGEYYTVTYAERILPLGQIVLKRMMDILGASVGCIFLCILTIILTPIIKMESKGPVFFVQNRVGRNGRIFKMYKFRSMYADAEERKKELIEKNEMQGLMFKMEKDPRITKVGGFLRKTSLDEFPQFINILKGDMSLVGTRPPTLDEFERYSPYHKKRLSFRPGLTGMWQVSGRSDITDFEEIVRLDVEYLENWSIRLDVKILLKTFFAVFRREGAK